jgi:hypothetical protein
MGEQMSMLMSPKHYRRLNIIFWLFIAALWLGASNTACAENTSNWFKFPSKTTRSASASGTLVASYKDPGADEDGVHAYRFSISDSEGRELSGFTFLRSVEGAWYDSSDTLFVNNFIGSNLTDCLVLRGAPDQFKLESLTDLLINKKRSGPMTDPVIKPPENPNNSHYYLKCDGWLDDHSLKLTLAGTTDAGGDFRYSFVFDTRTEKFATAR